MKEKILMRLQVSRNEVLTNLNTLFREKVQLEERLKETEGNIQWGRGYLEALSKAGTDIDEMFRGAEIEAMESEFSGDGTKDPVQLEKVK